MRTTSQAACGDHCMLLLASLRPDLSAEFGRNAPIGPIPDGRCLSVFAESSASGLTEAIYK